MRTLLHSLLAPASWKASLSSLVVHLGVLAACFTCWVAPIEHVSFSGRRNAVQVELLMQPAVDQQAQQQPVSLEQTPPVETAPPEPPRPAQALAIAPQTAAVQPEPPLPISIAQLTKVALQATEVAPQLGPPEPPRRAAQADQLPEPTPREAPPLEPHEALATRPPSTSATAVRQIAGVDDRIPPDFSNNPPPAYPSQAVAMRQQGTVLLQLHVTASGDIQRVEVLRSSGHAVLDQAALEAVGRWRGQPAYQGGTAIETVEELQVRFIL